MAKDDFYLFEDVLKELELNESELKRMVSEGEIRAFRDADKIKFKKSDVDDLRKGKTTEPTVILPPGEIEIPAAKGSSEAFIEEDTTSDIGATEEMLIDGEITVPSLDEDTGLGEETSSGEGVTLAEEVSETIAEDLSETVAEPAGKARPSAKMRRFAPGEAATMTYDQFPQMLMPPPPQVKTPPVFMYLLGASLFLLIFAGAFLVDSLRISSNKGNHPTTLTRELGQTILGIVGIKDVSLDKYKPNFKQTKEDPEK
jgi:hypothetical protein